MATIVTGAAEAGYEREASNPFLHSSPNWMAYAAGQAMNRCGYTKPVRATMGRGYQVNVWTAANQFRVAFDKQFAPTINRLG